MEIATPISTAVIRLTLTVMAATLRLTSRLLATSFLAVTVLKRERKKRNVERSKRFRPTDMMIPANTANGILPIKGANVKKITRISTRQAAPENLLRAPAR